MPYATYPEPLAAISLAGGGDGGLVRSPHGIRGTVPLAAVSGDQARCGALMLRGLSPSQLKTVRLIEVLSISSEQNNLFFMTGCQSIRNWLLLWVHECRIIGGSFCEVWALKQVRTMEP